jgi:hypothetical protein
MKPRIVENPIILRMVQNDLVFSENSIQYRDRRDSFVVRRHIFNRTSKTKVFWKSQLRPSSDVMKIP